MHATLLSILGLALLSALHAQDSVPVQTDFQQDKLTGRWYSIGLASNSNWFKEKKHLMKMCTTVISATADGNLEVTSTYPKGDQCEKRNSLYIKTEQPGRFSYTSPRWGSKHDIRVVETNYEEYALVATQISKSTGSSTMVLLYSRTKELSPERLERFTQFSGRIWLDDVNCNGEEEGYPPPGTNGTFNDSGAGPGWGTPYPLHTTVTLISLAGLLMLFTVFGNVLVIIAVFTSRALKAPQNLFLVSLASADILVATLVIPFSLANEVMGYWYFGKVWCEIYLALDVLFCTSSIVHLCAISLDRYWSITQAIEYNLKRTPRRIKCIIFIVWVISAVISFPPLISIEKKSGQQADQGVAGCKINDEKWYIISSSIGSFFAPCLIMILVYMRIYQIAKRRTRVPPNKRAERPEKRQNGLADKEDLPATAQLNGEKAAGGGSGQEGEANGIDMEESSSSEHQENNQCKKTERLSRGKTKTKLSQIKPGDSLPRKAEEERNTKGSRWRGRQNREKRFTFVLAVVIGVFVICWFPFFFTYTLMAVCKSCSVPDTLFKFFFWFGYCNSSLNPVIYTIFNHDFRRAFKRILCRIERKRIV